MTRQHNFKEIKGSTRLDKDRRMIKSFECNACNSLVAFPANYTEERVNIVIAQHPKYLYFTCKEPFITSN